MNGSRFTYLQLITREVDVHFSSVSDTETIQSKSD